MNSGCWNLNFSISFNYFASLVQTHEWRRANLKNAYFIKRNTEGRSWVSGVWMERKAKKERQPPSPPRPPSSLRCSRRLQSAVLTDCSGRKLTVQSQSALEIRPIRNAYRYPCKPAGYQNKLLGAVAQTVHIRDLNGLRSRLPPPPRYKISSFLIPEEGWILRLHLR